MAHPDTWETILVHGKQSWYTIDRIFRKTKVCQPKNELYKLTEVDREILESKGGWLKDNLMNARQQLIC